LVVVVDETLASAGFAAAADDFAGADLTAGGAFAAAAVADFAAPFHAALLALPAFEQS
jgi:hypothetical protein